MRPHQFHLSHLSLIVALVLCARTVYAQDCGRDCLESMLDRYVDALVSRDPSKRPAAPSLVFTENGQRLEPGDGLWHTVTGRGGYALRLADVERGQTVLMGTVREADVPTILVVRLKVVRRRIEEAETLTGERFPLHVPPVLPVPPVLHRRE